MGNCYVETVDSNWMCGDEVRMQGVKNSKCYEFEGRDDDEFKKHWAKDGTESKNMFSSARRATKKTKLPVRDEKENQELIRFI